MILVLTQPSQCPIIIQTLYIGRSKKGKKSAEIVKTAKTIHGHFGKLWENNQGNINPNKTPTVIPIIRPKFRKSFLFMSIYYSDC